MSDAMDIVQTNTERRMLDTLEGVRWAVSLLKHWLLGTHAGAIQPKHLQGPTSTSSPSAITAARPEAPDVSLPGHSRN